MINKPVLNATRERAFFDAQAYADMNRWWGALADWWVGKRLGPYSVEGIARIVEEFHETPLEVILATLDATLAKSKQRPRTWSYFWAALEEGRHAWRKSPDPAVRRGTGVSAIGDLLPALLERLERPRKASGASGDSPASRPSRAPGAPS